MNQTIRRAAPVLLVVVLLAATAVQTWRIQEAEARKDSRAAALVAARHEVKILVSISAKSSDADIERLLAGATDKFRSDFAVQAENFKQQILDGNVTSIGDVTSAGLISSSDERASVAVAATGSVTNDKTKEPEPRYYRLRVDLERVADKWLVSNLEFVA